MKLWPLAVIFGLVVAIVVNVAFLIVALSGDTAIIEDRPYERGQEFEAEAAAMRLAARTGVDFWLVNTKSETCLKLSRGVNPRLLVATLKIALRRPNRPASDVFREFLQVGSEESEFCLGAALEPGLWLTEMRLNSELGVMLVKKREMVDGVEP